MFCPKGQEKKLLESRKMMNAENILPLGPLGREGGPPVWTLYARK